MDFDVKRNERLDKDRTFTIAGRDLHFKPAVTPETFARYVDLVSGKLDLTEIEAIGVLDDTINEFLSEDSRSVWLEARKDDTLENPITSADMHEVIAHMWEVVSSRPTQSASVSGGGAPGSGTPSTAPLPSPEVMS